MLPLLLVSVALSTQPWIVFSTSTVATATPTAIPLPPAMPPEITTARVESPAVTSMSPRAPTVAVPVTFAVMVFFTSLMEIDPPRAKLPARAPPMPTLTSTTLEYPVIRTAPFVEVTLLALTSVETVLRIRFAPMAAPMPTDWPPPIPPAIATLTVLSAAETSISPEAFRLLRVPFRAMTSAVVVLPVCATAMLPAMPAFCPPPPPTATAAKVALLRARMLMLAALLTVLPSTAARAALVTKFSASARPMPAVLPKAKPPARPMFCEVSVAVTVSVSAKVPVPFSVLSLMMALVSLSMMLIASVTATPKLVADAPAPMPTEAATETIRALLVAWTLAAPP